MLHGGVLPHAAAMLQASKADFIAVAAMLTEVSAPAGVLISLSVADATPMLQLFLPQLLALKPGMAARGADSEMVAQYVSLTVAIGRVSARLLATGPSGPDPSMVQHMLTLLLELVAHPDPGCAETALQFFGGCSFALLITHLEQSWAHPMCSQLLAALVHRVAFPPHFTTWDASDADPDEFNSFRYGPPPCTAASTGSAAFLPCVRSRSIALSFSLPLTRARVLSLSFSFAFSFWCWLSHLIYSHVMRACARVSASRPLSVLEHEHTHVIHHGASPVHV